jgi:hypothetical protein
MIAAQGRGGAPTPTAAGPANVATYYPNALEMGLASCLELVYG